MTAFKDTDALFKISLIDLKKVTNRLFDHIIETRGEKEVTVGPDKIYYWDTALNELFNIDNKPTDFDIGSLEDDWEFLSKLLNENEIPVARLLTNLSMIYRVIGENLGDRLASKGG